MNEGIEQPAFFVEEFLHTLDKQRRVAIPATWRNSDGSGSFVLVPSADRSLKLITCDVFRRMVVEKAGGLSLGNSQDSANLARVASRAQMCVCDKQGRIQISQKLAEHAGLTDRVALVGAFNYAQLWNPDRWNEINSGSDNSIYEIFDKISTLPDGKK